MKYDLIIKDMTQAEVARVINLMNNEDSYQADDKARTELQNARIGGNVNTSPEQAKEISKAATFAKPDPVALYEKLGGELPQPEAPKATFRAGDNFTPPDAPTATVDITFPRLTPATNIELDSKGMPWDDRIHASTKTKTQKGEWKSKRGVSDELVAQVEAELKTGAIATQQPPAGMQFNTSAPVNPQPMNPPAPIIIPNPPITDFSGLMQKIAIAYSQNVVDAVYIAQLAAKVGQAFNRQVNSITEIAAEPQMIAYAVEILKAEGKLV